MPRVWPTPAGPNTFSDKKDENPGTILRRDNGVVALSNQYLDLAIQKEAHFHTVDFEMLKPPVDPKDAGLGRFRSKESAIDPKSELWFRLLEYGGTSVGPRFLVAVCASTKAVNAADGSMDVVWFYPPTTIVKHPRLNFDVFPPSKFPFRDDYPYVEITLENGQAGQPYPSLAFTYLLADGNRGGFKFANQLLAAGKAAVLVMPISPFGQMGPLLTRAGVARLLREVSYFALGMGLGEGSASLPQVNRVAVCGYSAGMNHVDQLMSADRGVIEDNNKQSYDRTLWGADAQVFYGSWKEIWVMDGAGSFAALRKRQTAISAWLGEDKERQTRIYQTEFTLGSIWSPSSDSTNDTPFVRYYGATPIINSVKDEQGALLAEEIHSTDRRVSAAFFRNQYLTFPKGSDFLPEGTEFKALDAHHVVPLFTIGHAAAGSRMRPLP